MKRDQNLFEFVKRLVELHFPFRVTIMQQRPYLVSSVMSQQSENGIVTSKQSGSIDKPVITTT